MAALDWTAAPAGPPSEKPRKPLPDKALEVPESTWPDNLIQLLDGAKWFSTMTAGAFRRIEDALPSNQPPAPPPPRPLPASLSFLMRLRQRAQDSTKDRAWPRGTSYPLGCVQRVIHAGLTQAYSSASL
ncbi:hypothetical protein GQ53DRAFT_418574 [Thozetella sp. PMI_491]|nr:hypothetical protein GQ53DRAFT_418574 [Thozetella sp. PMI_491]